MWTFSSSLDITVPPIIGKKWARKIIMLNFKQAISKVTSVTWQNVYHVSLTEEMNPFYVCFSLLSFFQPSASPLFWGLNQSRIIFVNTQWLCWDPWDKLCCSCVLRTGSMEGWALLFPDVWLALLCQSCFPRISASVWSKQGSDGRKKRLKLCKGEKWCMGWLQQAL